MELSTRDLVLRTVTAEDINEVSRMWEYPEGSISLEEAQNAIDYMLNNHKQNKSGYIYHICFAVFEKGNNKIIGWCGLDGRVAGDLQIFYMIDAGYRNKGFATQCAAMLLSYAFDEVRVPFVNGGCDRDNIASYKVMEKAGMQNKGVRENGNPLFYMDDKAYRIRFGYPDIISRTI